jgi:hypothetical protein
MHLHTQTGEQSEEVWRAAMGCLAQMCSHGGHWVASWVQPMPPSALARLLFAAWSLDWSHELYAQLLRLVPCVLLGAAAAAGAQQQQQQQQHRSSTSPRSMASAFAASGAVKSAAVAAAADDAAAAAAAAMPPPPPPPTALGSADAEEARRRIGEFGGLPELLMHFVRAPTPDSRAALLVVLVQCCCVDAPEAASGGGGGGEPGVQGSVPQVGLRTPRASGSPGSRQGLEGGGGGGGGGGPSAVLAVLQGLHLDSVCLVLRAAMERPWKVRDGPYGVMVRYGRGSG